MLFGCSFTRSPRRPFAVPSGSEGDDQPRRQTARFRFCVKGVLLPLVLNGGLAGCATWPIIDPYVDPSEYSKIGTNYQTAVANANNLRQQLAEGRRSIEIFDFTTGATLIGAGIAGLALGLFDASSDAILGVLVGGGVVTAGRAFIPIADRRTVYSKGLEAVTCAITATSGLSPRGDADLRLDDDANRAAAGLQRNRSGLATSRNALEVELNSLASTTTQPNVGPGLAAAMSLANSSGRLLSNKVAEAAAAVARVEQLAAEPENVRAARLNAVVPAIADAVNKGLLESPIDAEAALDKALDALKGDIEADKNAARDALEDVEASADMAAAASEGARAAAQAQAQERPNQSNEAASRQAATDARTAIDGVAAQVDKARRVAEQGKRALEIFALAGIETDCLAEFGE